MAIDPATLYGAQVDTSTDPTGYPYGQARNDAVAGDGTGTPGEKNWLSDLWGFCQALLSDSNQTPTGTPDKVGASQYLDAINYRLGMSGRPIAWSYYVLNGEAVEGDDASLAGEDGTVSGLAFRPDGSTMYVGGSDNDAVFQYALTLPWLLSSAAYASKSLDVSGESTQAVDVKLSADGLSMYVLGSADTIFQYTLGTAWDASTGSYASKSLDVSPENTAPTAIAFKPDGLILYVAGAAASGEVNQYTLGTAWDLSTASFASKTLSTTAQDTVPQGMHFRADGKKLFLQGITDDTIMRYTLGTAWDISTATFETELAVGAISGSYSGMEFRSDGSKAYLIDTSGTRVVEVYTSRAHLG